MIRGKAGTSVKLRILKDGKANPPNMNSTAATIPLETVLGDAPRFHRQMIYRLANHPRIGYIRIFDKLGEPGIRGRIPAPPSLPIANPVQTSTA